MQREGLKEADMVAKEVRKANLEKSLLYQFNKTNYVNTGYINIIWINFLEGCPLKLVVTRVTLVVVLLDMQP